MGESDGVAEGGDVAGVGALVSLLQVVDPQVVSSAEREPGVGADHHAAGGDHLVPVLPHHHVLAQVLGGAGQGHLVTHG